MKKFFIHSGTEHLGPYDLEDLKTKGITKDTPVWFQGLDEWTTAGKVDELSELLKAITPPPYYPQEPMEEPQILWGMALLTKVGNLSVWRWIQISATIILIVFLLGKYPYENGKRGKWKGARSEEIQQEKTKTVEEVERSQPTKYLTTKGTFKAGFWGHKIRIQGVVKSSATIAVYKRAVVRVVSYDQYKKELRREDFTLSDTLKPHSEIQFDLKIDKVNNLDTITWKIVQAKPL